MPIGLRGPRKHSIKNNATPAINSFEREKNGNFYFVSEPPKFENLFFFVFVFWSLFSNLLISMIWNIFLDIMDSLLIKYDMMIFFPDFLSGFRFFSVFSGIHQIFRFLHKMNYLLLTYYLMIFVPEIFPASGFSSNL